MRRLILVLVLAMPCAAHAEEPLAPGRVLDAGSAPAAEPLLAPEVLAHYKAGDYRNTIAAWPAGPAFEPAFEAASKKNAEHLDVDDRGTIVARGGAAATGVYGLPFAVAAADPHAGVKVMWNAYYALWRIGSTHDALALEWIGRTSRQREAVLDSHLLFYDGAPPDHAPKENPLGLAQQTRALVSQPADLNGTASLAWRFHDPDRQDQSWTYVPALRRVRQVSPANRSDGFLGSDLTQDDGAIFDGKPEDFTWKLVGEREALVLADPASLAGTVQRTPLANGGFAEQWPADHAVVGYQDAGWKGLAWAPVAPVRVRRKLWIVEAVPRDPYYLYAKIELGIDQQTFAGATSRKFDAQGALLRSLEFLAAAPQPITLGGESLLLPASSMGYILAENLKQDRATVAGTTPPGKSVHERRVPIDPALFALERLGQGK